MTATHPPQDEGTAAEAGQAKVDRLRVATARWRITSPARTTRRGRQLHQLVIDCTQVFLRSFVHYGLYLDSMTGFQASRVEDCRPRRAHDGPPDWSTDSRSALPTCVRAPSSRAVDIGARAWHMEDMLTAAHEDRTTQRFLPSPRAIPAVFPTRPIPPRPLRSTRVYTPAAVSTDERATHRPFRSHAARGSYVIPHRNQGGDVDADDAGTSDRVSAEDAALSCAMLPHAASDAPCLAVAHAKACRGTRGGGGPRGPMATDRY